jgi:hypothetical protein
MIKWYTPGKISQSEIIACSSYDGHVYIYTITKSGPTGSLCLLKMHDFGGPVLAIEFIYNFRGGKDYLAVSSLTHGVQLVSIGSHPWAPEF